MIDQDKSRRGPPRRDALCYQTQREIVIPAGTILRSAGDDTFACDIGIGSIVVHGKFSVTIKPSDTPQMDGSLLKRVFAS